MSARMLRFVVEADVTGRPEWLIAKIHDEAEAALIEVLDEYKIEHTVTRNKRTEGVSGEDFDATDPWAEFTPGSLGRLALHVAPSIVADGLTFWGPHDTERMGDFFATLGRELGRPDDR